ncbi:hypothetical protein GQ53DRAFT_416162 [Thozetella sp. PMI_491]|nr:hypothetical protein GQ53DRAFT_416162 [Thozetella sp. PMI_491]
MMSETCGRLALQQRYCDVVYFLGKKKISVQAGRGHIPIFRASATPDSGIWNGGGREPFRWGPACLISRSARARFHFLSLAPGVIGRGSPACQRRSSVWTSVANHTVAWRKVRSRCGLWCQDEETAAKQSRLPKAGMCLPARCWAADTCFYAVRSPSQSRFSSSCRRIQEIAEPSLSSKVWIHHATRAGSPDGPNTTNTTPEI